MEDFDHLLSEVNLEEICCHTSTNKPAKTAFYLTPLKKPKDICWYSEVPVGNNALSQHQLCTSAGIKGYKTNHSLRVTSATRMFQDGVNDQLIISRTGHRSIEGVRTYKRILEEQRMELSHVLNNATNGNRATKNISRKADNATVSVFNNISIINNLICIIILITIICSNI